jgi:putative ABC transport system permease protein
MNRTRLIAHSARTIARYKLRSGFIMLGAFVGVAALTLVVSVGQGVERKLLRTVRQMFGASSIVIFDGGHRMMGGPRGSGARLTLDDIEAVAKEVPGIEAWDPQQLRSSLPVRHGDASTTSRVVGQSERGDVVWERRAVRGAYFDAAAVKASARVALIGETVARRLFRDEDPIGGEILVETIPFRVIGILESFGTDVHGMDRDNEVVVPISTMMRRVMNVDTISSAKVIVKDIARSEATAAEITRVLRTRHAIAADQTSDFSIVTPVEVQQMVGWSQRILDLYLPLVAGISLIVCGIVAASLMLVSVNERVGEIGLRRAVGARPEDIGLQFLVETTVTTFVGGLGGLALGYLGAHAASIHLHLGDILSWRAVLIGMTASILTGLLAGVAPARRAARLQPADALR